jgi:hypothetical protein
MSNDIVTRSGQSAIGDAILFAKNCGESSLIPIAYRGKIADVVTAVLWGKSLGLEPLQALSGIAVINSRACVWGDTLLALARSRSDCKAVKETFDENSQTATCSITRGSEVITRSFSKKDAELARLWSKAGPWSQYPRRMLQMRARSWAIRDAYADALMGVYVAEEAQDIVEAEIIDGPTSKRQPAATISIVAHEVKPSPIPAEVKNAPANEIEIALKQLGLEAEIKDDFIAARGNLHGKDVALKSLGFQYYASKNVWCRKAA